MLGNTKQDPSTYQLTHHYVMIVLTGLLLTLLLCGVPLSAAYAYDAATTDTDGDGVMDSVDLDADNDGILGSVECPSGNQTANLSEDLSVPLTSPLKKCPRPNMWYITGAVYKIGAANDPCINLSYYPITDHTTGSKTSGEIYAANAGGGSGKMVTAFNVDFPVTPHQDYTISFAHVIWAGTASIYANEKLIFSSSEWAANFGIWTVENKAWNSGDNTELTLRFDIRQGAGLWGHDYMFDDIMIKMDGEDSGGSACLFDLDLDSDDDGIPDNVEAQATLDYIPPSNTDSDHDGLDDAYDADNNDPSAAASKGLIPVNTHNSAKADFLNTDTDNGQGTDDVEADLVLLEDDSDTDGLVDSVDTNNSQWGPVNAGVTNTLLAYPNNGEEVYWRTADPKPMCAITSGESSEVKIAVSGQIKKDSYLIIPSTILSPRSGQLRAFEIDDNAQEGKPVWSAADLMSESIRKSSLFVSNTFGNLSLFSLASKEHFGVESDNEASLIKYYTLNPSYDGGQYLAGREEGSFIGGLSRGNQVVLIDNMPDGLQYQQDESYRQYAQSYIVQRKKQVLFSSDDGFLYNVDYETGKLLWGWTPSSLLKKLKNYKQFQAKHWMKGEISVIDAKDNNGVYGTYIVGSYNGGLAHYLLKYNSDDKTTVQLERVLRDDDDSESLSAGVANGAKTFFSDVSGSVYSIHGLITQSGSSVLRIQSIADDSVSYSIALTKKITAAPYVVPNYYSRLAPPAKSLYLGMEDGTVLSAVLLKDDGKLKSSSNIKSELNKSAVASMTIDEEAEGITYLGVVSSKRGVYYLRTQTTKRLTVHNYHLDEEKWKPSWTSYVSGAGKWGSDGAYQEATDPIPAQEEGHPVIPPESGVQGLPELAEIADAAYIVSNSLVLPVNMPGEPTCKAYYYLYSLESGGFPQLVFYKPEGDKIVQHIELGLGKAATLELADRPEKSQLLGYGNVDQNTDGSVGTSSIFAIIDKVTGGVLSWRIVQ